MNDAIPSWSDSPKGSFGEFRFVHSGTCERTFLPLPARAEQLQCSLETAGSKARLGCDVYFGLNPRLRLRGDNGSVYCYKAFFADVDDGKGVCDPQLLQALPPTLYVHSGHGWHLYWLLKLPVLVRDGLEVARKLCHIAGSDAVWSPAQTPRLPGTLNWKLTPVRPVMLTARHGDGYHFKEIGEVVHGLLPGTLPSLPRPVRVAVPRVRAAAKLFSGLLPDKLRRLYQLYDTEQPNWLDRSRADAALARWAVAAGWTDMQIAQLLAAPRRAKLVERLRFGGTLAASHYLNSTIGWARRSVAREQLHAS